MSGPFDSLVLGCGEDKDPTAWNVDVDGSVEPDEVWDLDEYPWPWEDESFSEIRASHVLEHLEDIEASLRECSRILEPGGRLVVRWPMGLNELADPDHEQQWVWDTPLYYCGERHWDADVGLEVVDRNATVHYHYGPLTSRWKQFKARVKERMYGQGRWMFDIPATSGEFIVAFRKTSDSQ